MEYSMYDALIELNEQILNEDSELYKGIFWIVDQENLENNKDYCIQILCDLDGHAEKIDTNVEAKSGDTYNHKKYWELLPKELTQGKSFDYYPRGRIEINNSKVTIYLNPWIATDEVKNFLINTFNLTSTNGIKNVRLFPDGSEHYKCYLDR